MAVSSESQRTPSIVRAIGRWDLVALMINVTVGAGVLGLPARIFALAGPESVFVLIACAVLVGVIALCFAEVGSRFSDSGGPYLIARTAFGPASGFLVGALYWISRVLTFATICNLLAVYAARLHPLLANEAGRIGVVCVVSGGITIVHLIGVRHATLAGNVLTALKVLLLGALGVLDWSARARPRASRRVLSWES